MKTRFAALLLLMGILILPGCMKVRMETTVEKDGSGTMSMSFAMSESVAEAMKELEELGPMPGMEEQGPKLSDFDKEKMEKACKEHGVTLKSFNKSTENGSEKVEMTLAFKNLDDLSAVMGEDMGKGGGMFGIFKNADGNYVMKGVEGEPSMNAEEAEEETPEAPSEEEFDPAKAGKAMEIMGKMMSAISELDVVMRITVPGDILSTSAPKTEGRTAIWEINGDNMMNMTGMEDPEVVFSSKGLNIKAKPLPEE